MDTRECDFFFVFVLRTGITKKNQHFCKLMCLSYRRRQKRRQGVKLYHVTPARDDIQIWGAWSYKKAAARGHSARLARFRFFAKPCAQNFTQGTKNQKFSIKSCQLGCVLKCHCTVDNSFVCGCHQMDKSEVQRFLEGCRGQV